MFRIMIVIFVVAAFSAVIPGQALAYPAQGVISGTVAGGGEPLHGAYVLAFSSRAPIPLAYAVTDSNGRYRLQVPRTGSYRICAVANNHAFGCYQGATSLSAATPVVVSRGSSVQGVDFDLPAFEFCQYGCGQP
jgi:hypothetical protein